jgi:hypothetical protein
MAGGTSVALHQTTVKEEGMYQQHMLQLESRRAHESEPLRAAEISLRARELARLQRRDRAGPSHELEGPARAGREARRVLSRALGV